MSWWTDLTNTYYTKLESFKLINRKDYVEIVANQKYIGIVSDIKYRWNKNNITKSKT